MIHKTIESFGHTHHSTPVLKRIAACKKKFNQLLRMFHCWYIPFSYHPTVDGRMKMAQTAHTGGPYRLSDAVMDGFRPIMAPGGVIVALVPAPNYEKTGMVLAAAPDLLNAAQCALATIDATLAARGYREGECTDQWSPEVRGEVAARAQLRAALAKAEGR